jgi:hypothetical protein
MKLCIGEEMLGKETKLCTVCRRRKVREGNETLPIREKESGKEIGIGI